MLPQQPQRHRDEIAEIHAALLPKETLVGRVGRRELLLLADQLRTRGILRWRSGGREPGGVGGVFLGRDVLILGPAEQGDERVDVPGGIAERPEVLEGEIEEPLAHEDDLFGLGQHPEVRGQPQMQRVLPQHPVAKGVEGADPGLRVAVGHEAVDALLHLGRGAVGEGQRQNLLRPGAAGGDQMGDPPGNHGRFPRPRPRHDQQRALAVRHRRELLPGQPLEDRVHRAGRRLARRGGGWLHGRDGAFRDGQGQRQLIVPRPVIPPVSFHRRLPPASLLRSSSAPARSSTAQTRGG